MFCALADLMLTLAVTVYTVSLLMSGWYWREETRWSKALPALPCLVPCFYTFTQITIQKKPVTRSHPIQPPVGYQSVFILNSSFSHINIKGEEGNKNFSYNFCPLAIIIDRVVYQPAIKPESVHHFSVIFLKSFETFLVIQVWLV